MADLMTPQYVVGLFKLMATLYPASAKNFAAADAFTRDAWYEMVKDLPAALVLEAIKSHAATHTFAPSIAEIRTAVMDAALPENRIDADEAWSYVRRAIAKYGYTQKQRALSSMPEPVAQCVERFGWREICLSENVDVVRGQFLRAYERGISRRRNDALVPLAVRERLAALASGVGGRLEPEELLLQEGT